MDLCHWPIEAKREALALLERKAELARQREREAERRRMQESAETTRRRCESLAGFVRAAWHVLEPNAELVWNWHLDALCAHLEAITAGRINRLLANVPPGSSKSMIVSVMWPAWEWGPRGMSSLRYLTTAFNEGPVKRDTRKSRDLILSDWYRTHWPEVRLTRTGETSFANDNTGTREGVAFGSLTSQRGDRLIIDDPHSTETAESEAERTATTRKFREGAMNRLNDQEKSAVVVIMQRLHEEDISGVIQKLGMGFVHLCLPMEFEPERRCETEIGFVDPRGADGELLDPVRFPRQVVEALKRDMGSYAYAGQYQQRPTSREGGLFKRSWFNPVAAVPVGPRRRVRAWDLAATKKTTSNNPDWTAGVLVSRGNDGRFLVEGCQRFRGSPMEVDAAVTATAPVDGVSTIVRLTQDPGQAGKAQAEQFVRKLAGFNVVVKPATGDKATRATPAAVQCEAGNVDILVTGDPDRDAWVEPFLAELCLFPAGANDDQVDAFADAINELALGARLTRFDVL
jgi:predicted phage terminase large subunit-like protein